MNQLSVISPQQADACCVAAGMQSKHAAAKCLQLPAACCLACMRVQKERVTAASRTCTYVTSSMPPVSGSCNRPASPSWSIVWRIFCTTCRVLQRWFLQDRWWRLWRACGVRAGVRVVLLLKTCTSSSPCTLTAATVVHFAGPRFC